MLKMDEKGVYWTNRKKNNTRFQMGKCNQNNNYAQSLWKA